ncbi:hypothetical protein M1D52_06715 [Olivibacter sp. SA151]|uniref:SGNH/GDSL hydrolase family protein n=1 Tax=Olivibacter jilunii TaxID=985016 RepID=UPI003F152240
MGGVLIESIIRENGYFGQVGNNVTRQNESISNLSALKNEKNKDIFSITVKQLIGNDHEATMMVQHLTDLRFTRISETINKVLEQAINK